MKIRTKLIGNLLIVLFIIGVMAIGSILGMNFIKEKLLYLTERSTPYQIKSLEFQRALQGISADLVKVSASKSWEEYKSFRSEAEKSLDQVKKVYEELLSLEVKDSKRSSFSELENIVKEIFEVTENRLKAEEEALSAFKGISQKLREITNKLKNLDAKIASLQTNRSAAFFTSLEETKGVIGRKEALENLKGHLKDLQLWIQEIQGASNKRALIITRNKISTTLNKISQNLYVRTSKSFQEDLKHLRDQILSLIDIHIERLEKGNSQRGEEKLKIITESLTNLLLKTEEEKTLLAKRSEEEAVKQEKLTVEANVANSALLGSSKLMSLGFSFEGLTTKLFTALSSNELNLIEGEIKRTFEEINTNLERLEKALKKLGVKEELRTLGDVKASFNTFKGVLWAKEGILEKLRYRITMKEKALEAENRLREILLKQAEETKKTVSTAQGDQEKAIISVNRVIRFNGLLIIGIGIGAAILGILFGFWIYRSISKPIRDLIWEAEEIANGNLRCKIERYSKDEIGLVHQSMCKVIGNLSEMVIKMKEAMETLATSAHELSSTALNLSQNSSENQNQVEQVVSAVTEMDQTIQEVAKNTLQTAEVSQKMKESALTGKQIMETTVEEIKKFIENVNNSALKVEALGEKSKKINEIINLIKEIAEQTNLLALNAAIEAARAGEHGKGFAVVAEEVKQLAQRTSQATDEIANTIKTIQIEVKDSVDLMKSSKEAIGKMVENINTILSAIENIVNFVEEVTDRINIIATATEEESVTSNEISRNMQTIASLTKELNNLVNQIKKASEKLFNIADELNSMVSWFKV